MAKEKPKDEAQRDEENPEYENFQRLLKQVLSVPKEKLEERKADRKRKKKGRNSPQSG